MNAIRTFEEIPVSTYTFVARSNVFFNLEKMHNVLPISDSPNSIKSLKYTGPVSKKTIHKLMVTCRGAANDRPNMLHACTLHYVLPEKVINIKMYSTGSMQITGCKTHDQCHKAVLGLYRVIRASCPDAIYSKSTTENTQSSDFVAVFRIEVVMKNVHFDLGFKVSRPRFVRFFSNHSDFNYIMTYEDQTTAGLNIKHLISDVTEDVVTFLNIGDSTHTVTEQTVSVQYHPAKAITFIVFYSGICRYSGCNNNAMERAYYKFLNLILAHRSEFEDDVQYARRMDSRVLRTAIAASAASAAIKQPARTKSKSSNSRLKK